MIFPILLLILFAIQSSYSAKGPFICPIFPNKANLDLQSRKPEHRYEGIPVLFPSWQIYTNHYLTTLAVPRLSDKIAFAGRGPTAFIADQTGTITANINNHSAWINQIAASDDGALFASASLDKSCRFWNARGDELFSLNDVSEFDFVEIARDGTVAVCGARNGNFYVVWPKSTVKQINFQDYFHTIAKIRISEDGHKIVIAGTSAESSSQNRILQLDKDGRVNLNLILKKQNFSPPNNQVSGLEIDKDGFIFSALYNQTFHLIPTVQGQSPQFYRIDRNPEVAPFFTTHLESAAMSPDSERIVLGYYDLGMIVFDRRSNEFRPIPEPGFKLDGILTNIHVSPDNKHFISVNMGSPIPELLPRAVVLWSYDGRPVAMLGGINGTGWPLDLKFSADGLTVFGVTNSNSLVSWNLRDIGQSGIISSVALREETSTPRSLPGPQAPSQQ